jgi:hypothetical protein
VKLLPSVKLMPSRLPSVTLMPSRLSWEKL